MVDIDIILRTIFQRLFQIIIFTDDSHEMISELKKILDIFIVKYRLWY